MKTTDVLAALDKLGSAQTRKTYLRHGCPEPLIGIKIGDLKALIKKFQKVIDSGRHEAKRKSAKC